MRNFLSRLLGGYGSKPVTRETVAAEKQLQLEHHKAVVEEEVAVAVETAVAVEETAAAERQLLYPEALRQDVIAHERMIENRQYWNRWRTPTCVAVMIDVERSFTTEQEQVAVRLREAQFVACIDHQSSYTPGVWRINPTMIGVATGAEVCEVKTPRERENCDPVWNSFFSTRISCDQHVFGDAFKDINTAVVHAMNVRLSEAFELRPPTVTPQWPSLYLAFPKGISRADLVEGMMGQADTPERRTSLSAAQFTWLCGEVMRGQPVYANAAGRVHYVPKMQPGTNRRIAFNVMIAPRVGREVFAGVVPATGRLYVIDGSEVDKGVLLAAGFPQQGDLDGDGEVDDKEQEVYHPRMRLADFLRKTGNYHQQIKTILRNSIREWNELLYVPWELAARLFKLAVPEETLLVWTNDKLDAADPIVEKYCEDRSLLHLPSQKRFTQEPKPLYAARGGLRITAHLPSHKNS